MDRRLELDDLLRTIPEVGSHVYFQPPEGFKMEYPCIRYEINLEDVMQADNRIYTRMPRYTLTVIDYVPDSSISQQVGELLQRKLDRHYLSDNLHHFVYNLNW